MENLKSRPLSSKKLSWMFKKAGLTVQVTTVKEGEYSHKVTFKGSVASKESVEAILGGLGFVSESNFILVEYSDAKDVQVSQEPTREIKHPESVKIGQVIMVTGERTGTEFQAKMLTGFVFVKSTTVGDLFSAFAHVGDRKNFNEVTVVPGYQAEVEHVVITTMSSASVMKLAMDFGLESPIKTGLRKMSVAAAKEDPISAELREQHESLVGAQSIVNRNASTDAYEDVRKQIIAGLKRGEMDKFVLIGNMSGEVIHIRLNKNISQLNAGMRAMQRKLYTKTLKEGQFIVNTNL